jgi:hypothetical protein
MLLRTRTLRGIVAGEITSTFRWWRRPTVRESTALRTPVGLVRILSVEPVAPAAVTDDDARRAGFDDAAQVLDMRRDREGRTLYRIGVAFAGPDPRIALRERADLSDDDVEALRGRLARFDRSSRRGPWTHPVLELIAERPGVLAADLAAGMGAERDWFKRNVRKLKELGLTRSLEVGYERSPRGEALLRALAERP